MRRVYQRMPGGSNQHIKFDWRCFICQEKMGQDRSVRDLWQGARDAEGNAEESARVRRDIVSAPSAVRK
jgi:hypothetical protein